MFSRRKSTEPKFKVGDHVYGMTLTGHTSTFFCGCIEEIEKGPGGWFGNPYNYLLRIDAESSSVNHFHGGTIIAPLTVYKPADGSPSQYLCTIGEKSIDGTYDPTNGKYPVIVNDLPRRILVAAIIR